MKSFHVLSVLVWLGFAAHPVVRAQEEFLRGDVNDDGRVSISDAHRLELFLFQGADKPGCLKTADSNDDGTINITDSIVILNTLFKGGPRIPAPGQDVGIDPTDDDLSCEAYGGGAPIEDAGAAVEILDATSPGGDVGTANLQVRVSNTDAIGGYSGRIRSAENVFAGIGTVSNTSSLSGGSTFISAHVDRGEIVFAYVHDIIARESMPPMDGVLVMDIEVCLLSGLAAGSYPLTLDEAELVDAATGRAILPETIGGTLSVEADVTVQLECEFDGDIGDDGGNPPAPPRPESPEEVKATLRLETKAAESGTTASLAVEVEANTPIEGFTFSIDFDESRVQAVDATPSEHDWELFVFDIDNEDATRGNDGIAEGYIAGAAIFSRTNQDFFMSPDRRHLVLSIDFQVLPDAESGSSDVRFIDGGMVDGAPVSNGIRAFGQDLDSGAVRRLSLKDGALFIDPEGNEFLRGDVNIDGKVSISDPVMLRRYLFIGGNEPLCHDAADANDDGTINLTDVVWILIDLFLADLNRLTIPQPHPAPAPTRPSTCSPATSMSLHRRPRPMTSSDWATSTPCPGSRCRSRY